MSNSQVQQRPLHNTYKFDRYLYNKLEPDPNLDNSGPQTIIKNVSLNGKYLIYLRLPSKSIYLDIQLQGKL